MNLPKPHRTRSFAIVIAIVLIPALLVTTALTANQIGYCINSFLPDGDTYAARPYLLQVDSNSATVRLRSLSAIDAHLTYSATGGESISTTIPAHRLQTVELPDLQPDTVYTYTIDRDMKHWQGTFRTPPDASGAVRFDVFGSSGLTGDSQHVIADEMVADAPDFVLHTGDVVFPRGAYCHYGMRYFGPYQDLIGNAPVILAPGEIDLKTDNGSAFRDAFDLAGDPANDPLYRSFDYGPVHVAVLDSELYKSGDQAAIDQQRTWLIDDLQANTLPWTVVVVHSPLYSSTNDAVDQHVAADLGPLFADHGVDLVFSGHARNYERFQPDDGITYIVTGGGGAKLQALRDDRASVAGERVHHFVSVDASADEMTIRAIDIEGNVIDETTLKR